MGTLSAIMMNLKNELFQKYGYNNIFLNPYMNDDTKLCIVVNLGKYLSGEIFGQVELTEDGWELVGVNYEIFEGSLEFMKEMKEKGVLI
jgi:hypothetical protein